MAPLCHLPPSAPRSGPWSPLPAGDTSKSSSSRLSLPLSPLPTCAFCLPATRVVQCVISLFLFFCSSVFTAHRRFQVPLVLPGTACPSCNSRQHVMVLPVFIPGMRPCASLLPWLRHAGRASRPRHHLPGPLCCHWSRDVSLSLGHVSFLLFKPRV